MVRTTIRKDSFQPITSLGENVTLIRFSKETVYEEVYEGEGEDRHPTGERKETDLVTCTEEIIIGEFTPEKVRNVRLKEVETYDQSEDVNSLFVNAKRMWYDKVTRTCINYSIGVEKQSGAETTTLYDDDNVAYVLPIDMALSLFAQLELYAKACYNKTAEHKAELMALESAEDILAYDIKAGYPEKISVVIPVTEEEAE